MPPPPHPHPERRPAPRPDRRAILGIVWPIVLANAATPLLGLADTAVIGRYGTVVDLGAIALGALVFSFVYWGFGFLRMATTGFVAQADGAGDEPALRLAIARPLLLGALLGAAIVLLQRPIEAAALALLDGSAEVESITAAYLRTRIWGAPAALATYAVTGALIGLGLTRRLLVIQLAVNALNIGLDVAFAGPLALGAAGVALGTAIAEWFALGLSLALLVPALRRRRPELVPFVDWSALLDPAALRGLFAAQLDIMIRTLALLAGFGWFTNQGARFGDVTLAANHLLLQLVSFCAFVLDGFAFATESLVGRARGAGDRGGASAEGVHLVGHDGHIGGDLEGDPHIGADPHAGVAGYGGRDGAGHVDAARVGGAAEEEDGHLARRKTCNRVVGLVGDVGAEALRDSNERGRVEGLPTATQLDVGRRVPGVRDEGGEAGVVVQVGHVGGEVLAADGALVGGRRLAGVAARAATQVAALIPGAGLDDVAFAVEHGAQVCRALHRTLVTTASTGDGDPAPSSGHVAAASIGAVDGGVARGAGAPTEGAEASGEDGRPDPPLKR